MILWALFFAFLSSSAGLGQQTLPHQVSTSGPGLSNSTRFLDLTVPTTGSISDWLSRETYTRSTKSRNILQNRTVEPDPEDIPVNFVFHSFPNLNFENAAKHGVVDALRLANAALAATDDLTTSFDRYFQRDELDTVRSVFEAIITESVYVRCSDSHEINIWFEDSVGDFDGCAQGLAAYHLTPGPAVTGLHIVLCTELFHLYPQPLDAISRDDLKQYADESMETVGLTLLHELTHLSTVVGGLVISDVHIESALDVSPSNPLGYVKAYGPYLSMMANKDEHAGSLNADNFAFFAAESFFIQEFDIENFVDPPPSRSSNFHPARSLEDSNYHLVSGRKSAPSKPSIAALKNTSDIVTPPYKVPGPGFPQNWIFQDFAPENRGLLDLSIEGIVDAWRLADVAAESLLGDLTPSFYRYFQEEDACDVEDVFILILKQASLSPDPKYHARDWKVYYDDATMSDQLCHLRRDLAYFIESPNFASPAIVICPIQFETNSRLLDTISCSDIEPYASDGTMDNIGATLLHEMLHDYGMTGDANVFASDVQFKAPVVSSDGEAKNGYATGYGPYWSHYLNVNQHAGTSNVDNFVWYALETWFSRVCGIVFGDPAPTPADMNIHALRSFGAAGTSQILGRQLKNGTANVAREEPPGTVLDHLPSNIYFAEFPGMNEILAASGALVGAFTLAEPAVAAAYETNTGTFKRYFQPDQACSVQNVFTSILAVANALPQRPDAISALDRPYIIYYGDSHQFTRRCTAERSLSAYSVSTRVEMEFFLCPIFFELVTKNPDMYHFDCNILGPIKQGKRPSTPQYDHAALAMLHALLQDRFLTNQAASVVIEDKHWNDRKANKYGNQIKLISTGPYWSQWVNSKKRLGQVNTDNYVYFAFEVYFAQHCGYGLDGFWDAKPVPNPNPGQRPD